MHWISSPAPDEFARGLAIKWETMTSVVRSGIQSVVTNMENSVNFLLLTILAVVKGKDEYSCY